MSTSPAKQVLSAGGDNAADKPIADLGRLTLASSGPIICGLVLLLIICGTAAYQATQNRRQAETAAKSTQVVNVINAMRFSLLSAESSERGFLLKAVPPYRAQYDAAIDHFRGSEKRLAELLVSDAPGGALAARIATAADRKIDEMGRALGSAAGGDKAGRDKAGGVASFGDEDDQRLMQSAMDDLATLRRGAAASRDKAVEGQLASTDVLIGAIGFAAIGALLMAALAMLQVRDHLRLLRRRELQLDRLVSTLEARVAKRTTALAQANQRFQIALDSSEVTVFSQDVSLIYGWISRGTPDTAPSEIVGKTDAEFQPSAVIPVLERLKRGVLGSGEPVRTEMRMDYTAGTHWYDLTLVPTHDDTGAIDGLVGGAVDISERKQYEAHVRLLLREITHRSKNLLAVIQAIMRQTATHSISVSDFTARFSARMDALAGSLDLLVQEDWRGVTLADLVRSQLAHHADAGESQIELDGGRLQLPPDAAQNIGMALHELATNASKYGALSVPQGRVRVSWENEINSKGETFCRLSWEERNGPIVVAPSRRGFGQVVIERTVARAVGGKVTLSYPPEGVHWTLEFCLRPENVMDAA
jgi:two-component sensor histidine kinase/CHASE3 domain sensor protein